MDTDDEHGRDRGSLPFPMNFIVYLLFACLLSGAVVFLTSLIITGIEEAIT